MLNGIRTLTSAKFPDTLKILKKKSGFLCLVVDLDYLINYCTNPKLHFQMKFLLSSTWSLLILPNHVKASRL